MGNISDFPDADWDNTLLALDGHVLKSAGWLRVQRALGHDVRWARGDGVRAAADSRLDFARVEPTSDDALAALAATHARAAKPVQPRCTWVLDLTVDAETLRSGLESGHRSRINAAARRGITVRSSDDPDEVEIFLALQRNAAGRSGVAGQPSSYHHTIASVLMPLGIIKTVRQAADTVLRSWRDGKRGCALQPRWSRAHRPHRSPRCTQRD